MKNIEDGLIRLLERAKRGDGFHDIFASLGDPEFDEAVERAASYGYVEGIVPSRVASGRLTVDSVDGSFRITQAGIDYLSGKSL